MAELRGEKGLAKGTLRGIWALEEGGNSDGKLERPQGDNR